MSYKSIRHGLNINAQVVIDTIIDKIWTFWFFIPYNNINIYKGLRDQRIYNYSTIISYTSGYVCFMKTLGSTDDNNNIQAERNIDADKIN